MWLLWNKCRENFFIGWLKSGRWRDIFIECLWKNGCRSNVKDYFRIWDLGLFVFL